MAELLLDSDIRLWVFLPIVVLTFLVGIIRHYVAILLASEKKMNLQHISDSHALTRSRALRQNGNFIPRESFLSRKDFFNNETHGFFKTEKRDPFVTDPAMMMWNVTKNNLTNVLPMIVIGGWINWAFSGFLTAKIPFPLTLRFKPMLQRGVKLEALDASWVSSASWYFLNVFGLRSMYKLILGQDNAADQARITPDQMLLGAAMNTPQDPNKAFKAEWEALEIVDHEWALEGVEEEIMGTATTPPETTNIKSKVE